MNNSWKEELEKQLKALICEQNEENMNAKQEEERGSYYDTLMYHTLQDFQSNWLKT